MEYAVEAHGLSKIYKGKVHALKAVNLKVPAGSAFGLLGPNGAGKSTLVKTLLSIVRPTSGFATLLGRDATIPEARRHVGYLPEGHRYPQYLTGRGVCRYFGKLSGLTGPALEKDVEEKLDWVGMREWGDTRVSRYSKGMQQRVGLAQAMLGSPRLVFLDEPTDGVDPVGRQQIRDVIKQLCKGGTTVFLNSHLLLEVEQICDQVAIMHHGSVLQQGSVDQVRAAVKGKGAQTLVRFTTGPLPDAVRAALAALGPLEGPPTLAEEGGSFDLSVPGREHTSQAIDILRAASVPVFAVEPQRANLEDAFIGLITAQEDQAVGGTQLS